MSEKIVIDAIGMKCPRPVIELAKAARKAPGGAVIEISASDLAFESDVRAWCENQGAALLLLKNALKASKSLGKNRLTIGEDSGEISRGGEP